MAHHHSAISTQDLEIILRSLTSDTIPGVAALLNQAINGDPDARERTSGFMDAIKALQGLYSQHPDRRPTIPHTPAPRAAIAVEGAAADTSGDSVVPIVSAQDIETILRSLTRDDAFLPAVAILLSQAIHGDRETHEDSIVILKKEFLRPSHPKEMPQSQTPPRALIVVEGGVVTGTYEDPCVQVRVYDWDMADEEPVPPLPPEWRFLADQAGVPTELRFQWSPETDKADAVPRVLVTMSTSTVSLYYAENSVDVRLVDMDKLKAGGQPGNITGFEDLLERAISPEIRALLGLPESSDSGASPSP